MEGIETLVTVSGVVMKIEAESASCISGVEITTSILREGKPIAGYESSLAWSDMSGWFSISDMVPYPGVLQISFRYDNEAFSEMLVSAQQYQKQIDISAIIEYSQQSTS